MKEKIELHMDKYQEEGRKKYPIEYIKAAHKHTIRNYNEILQSKSCTCMYCGYHFDPEDLTNPIETVTENDGERTVLCNNCSVDSVIGDKSGLPVTDVLFIARFSREWFNGYSRLDDIGFSSDKIDIVNIEVE